MYTGLDPTFCMSVYMMYYITAAASPAEKAPAAAAAPGLLEPSPPES